MIRQKGDRTEFPQETLVAQGSALDRQTSGIQKLQLGKSETKNNRRPSSLEVVEFSSRTLKIKERRELVQKPQEKVDKEVDKKGVRLEEVKNIEAPRVAQLDPRCKLSEVRDFSIHFVHCCIHRV